MGFDLYGMKPEANTPEPEWTKGDPYISTDIEGIMQVDPQVKEEYDDYIKEKIKWQEVNGGAYFRSNVWYWRPLWEFVCTVCNNVLTYDDYKKGNWNDGHKISKTKTKRIASRLRVLLNNGTVNSYERFHKECKDELDDKNWDKSYPFSVEHVKEFERFCEKSGGFEIH
tara:strand:+ start:26 stop:532 length:507 start_codon:yes stop_codon:yes gene_type:complete